MDESNRRLHTKVLISLSKRSGLYPECLVLTDVQLTGKFAVARGGYGDIWRGMFQGKPIAVKVLHVYERSNLVKLLKVSAVHHCLCPASTINKQELASEAIVWRQLRHPNVLPFYGVYHQDNTRSRACLVSPWLENGNIKQFLAQNPDKHCVSLVHM
jgi:serine/threonine protein kinase